MNSIHSKRGAQSSQAFRRFQSDFSRPGMEIDLLDRTPEECKIYPLRREVEDQTMYSTLVEYGFIARETAH